MLLKYSKKDIDLYKRKSLLKIIFHHEDGLIINKLLFVNDQTCDT